MESKLAKRVLTCVFGILALLSVYPLFWMTVNSFKGSVEIVTGGSFGFPKAATLENYAGAIFERNILKYFANSVVVTSLTIVLTVLASTMLAYALSRMAWRGRDRVASLVTLGLLLPAQIVVVPVFILVRQLGLIDNPLSLVLSVSAFNIAMCTLIAIGFLRSIPFEMEEAAVMDGCGLGGIFFKVILPIIKPAVATMSVNIFLNSWNEFIYALTLINSEAYRTLPVGLMAYAGRYGTDFGGLFAAMVITSVIPVAVYVLFSEQVEKALTAGAVLK
jgi:raffinose/stachyose/melibiose transport system permease protein